MNTLQVVQHRPGPLWRSDVGFREQTGVEEHLATLQQWAVDDVLVMAGPFLDQQGGGLAIVRFSDVAAARSAAEADPAVVAGLLTVEVRPWLAGVTTVDLPADQHT